MCRCAERRSAIARGVRTLLQGEFQRAGAEAAFAVRSTAEDARILAQQMQAAASSKIAAARARLAAR